MAALDVSMYHDGEWTSLNTAITGGTYTVPAGTTITSSSIPTTITTTTTSGYPTVWGTGTTSTGVTIYPTYSDGIYETKTSKKAEADIAERDSKIENLEERLKLMERQVKMAQYDADVARVEADEYERMILVSTKGMDPEAVRGAQMIRDHIEEVVAKYVVAHPLPEDVDTED